MTENVENLLLEHLKKIQAELADSRERDGQLLAQLNGIESMVARYGRDTAEYYAELIADRHATDVLRRRLERIERRLELND